MLSIDIDSTFYVFENWTNKKGHRRGQLQIEVTSLEPGILNEELGKLNVKIVSYLLHRLSTGSNLNVTKEQS